MNMHTTPSITGCSPVIATVRRHAAAWSGALALIAPLLAMQPSAQAQTPALTPATGSATAEPAAPQPASAASAARPQRRYLSPDEKRDSATAPGALRPADPVVPQLRLALGRNGGAASGSATGDGAIDDDAARCRAQASAADRARCGAGTQKVVPKPTLRP